MAAATETEIDFASISSALTACYLPNETIGQVTVGASEEREPKGSASESQIELTGERTWSEIV